MRTSFLIKGEKLNEMKNKGEIMLKNHLNNILFILKQWDQNFSCITVIRIIQSYY